jgi:hypothetical protein
MPLPLPRWAKRRNGLRRRPNGYIRHMRTDDDTRSLEQEVAAGQSETTPVAVITSVVGVIACLVIVAVALAVLAYFLA